ncbi:MAG TPA: hypothetical protein VF033_00675 [Steroidobacteraceae bacterium]|jgi:hypothetical protein
MSERPNPDGGPSSDPEPGAPGTDIHDFERAPGKRRVFDAGVHPADPDETDPEGEHEKRRESARNPGE